MTSKIKADKHSERMFRWINRSKALRRALIVFWRNGAMRAKITAAISAAITKAGSGGGVGGRRLRISEINPMSNKGRLLSRSVLIIVWGIRARARQSEMAADTETRNNFFIIFSRGRGKGLRRWLWKGIAGVEGRW